MKLLDIARFIINHPLSTGKKFTALSRFARWQLSSRIFPSPIVVPFVNDSRLLMKRGMTGATANLYAGLHEFADMAFVLHVLRKTDVFVDVGANIGSYTVLAAKVVGSKSIAIEPVPVTFSHLLDNINLNRIYEHVVALNIGLASSNGTLAFTSALDSTNHVVPNGSKDATTVEVSVKKLDDVLTEAEPFLMKIDVEGYESEVVTGGEKVFRRSSLNAVVMELRGHGRRYGQDDSAVHQKMLDYGFTPCAYLPLKREVVSLGNKISSSGNTLYLRDIEEAGHRVRTAPGFAVNGKVI